MSIELERIYTIYHNKPMLADVVIMRIGLIFLLIGTHTFAPYSGSWGAIHNGIGLEIYSHISSITHYISMPALIFISGYLFGHSWSKVKTQSFKDFIIKKSKRLIIPSIIFSLFYFLLFNDISLPISKICYSIINGSGHLWFLPMLFWCFIITYTIHKLKLSYKIVIPILIITSIVPLPSLPLRITSTCTYLIFFYIGSLINTICSSPTPAGGGISLRHNTLALITLTAVYLALQYVLTEAKQMEHIALIDKMIYLFSVNAIKMMLGLCGIGIAFIATRMFLSNNKNLSENIITLSTYCYGVYILHQFILKVVYYKTSFVENINAIALPWIVFAITLTLSVFMTAMALKTKTGRYLIG